MQGISGAQVALMFTGAMWTVMLSAIGFAGGALLGLPGALARSSSRRWLRASSGLLVQIAQGVPLPVLMFIVYFGISAAGFNLPALAAAGVEVRNNCKFERINGV